MTRSLARNISIFLLAGLFTLVAAATSPVQAAQSGRKTLAMREKVYAKLSKAQEATEAENWNRAYELLDQVKKMKDLKPHEAAQLFTAYGYTYFAQEKYPESAEAYEMVLQQEDLAEAMRVTTLYTLGQLHFHLEHFDKAISYLEDWLKLAENPGPEPFVLLGQAHYQLGHLEQAAAPVRRAIAVAEARDQTVQENWYALLRVIYFETKDYANLLDVLEILVNRYPAKEYWIHLSSTYGEMGDSARQLAAYEMAYTQGYLTRSSEIVLLCQLLLQAEVPYRAGVILQEGMDSGLVDGTAANWRLLSQAWILAQENEAAIASLGKAAELSDDGELYARIAQSYANLNRWELAAQAAGTAIDRGVKNPQEMHVLRGMAFFELNQFDAAKEAFTGAMKFQQGRETASRWLAYIDREEQRLAELGLNP